MSKRRREMDVLLAVILALATFSGLCVARRSRYVVSCDSNVDECKNFILDAFKRYCESDLGECSGVTIKVEDSNECDFPYASKHGHNCNPEFADCINTEGSFHCVCKSGYSDSDKGNTTSSGLNCTELREYQNKTNTIATPLQSTTERADEDVTPSPIKSPLSTYGWTVFQRRQDGSVDFNRTWVEYVNGFGNESGEFWMGLEKLYQLTASGSYELRIDLADWENNTAFAEYSEFSVGSASSNYRLTVSGFSGTAGDALSRHSGAAFSAKDSDNDRYGGNCAADRKSGWWFYACLRANLNGLYYIGGKYTSSETTDGIIWYEWKSDWWYSMKFVEMKLRRLQ